MNVTAWVSGAALVPGRDIEYTDTLVVEVNDEGVAIAGGESRIKMSSAGALEMAEFILRNVEPD